MTKPTIAKSAADPREELSAIREFAKQREAELLPTIEKLELEERAKAEKAEADRLDAMRVEAAEGAKYLVELSAKIDTKLEEVARMLTERQEAAVEFARQYDRKVVFVGHQLTHAKNLDSALHAAGIGRFAHVLGRGKLTLEYSTRQMLGGLL